MKTGLSILLFLITYTLSFAQVKPVQLIPDSVPTHAPNVRICVPARGQLLRPPLIVVFSHKKVIFKDSTTNYGTLASLPPDDIQTINILNSPASVNKYGDIAKYGVVEVYLKHKLSADKIMIPDSSQAKRRR